jgi:peptidoglycan/xylan/chitin deacetylase (PgdA/CDA1 family)
MKKVLIINFHELCSTVNAPKGQKKIYTFEPEKFIAFLDFISLRKIPVVALHEMTTGAVKEDHSIALTFDDGNESDYSTVYPLLQSYDLKAAFFLSVNAVNEQKHGWDRIIEMSKNPGITFGSHSMTHRRMADLSTMDADYELRYSKQYIEDKINMPVKYFALPFGVWDKRIVSLSRQAGYASIFTTNVQLNYPELHPYLIHRWSPTSHTSLKLLEQMVTFDPVIMQGKIWVSAVKRAGKKVLGTKFSDRINQWSHS